MKPYITCKPCNAYSSALKRCSHGWANPRTLKGAIQCIELMGSSYVCNGNKFKHKAMDIVMTKNREMKRVYA